jgi:hypothetical protein
MYMHVLLGRDSIHKYSDRKAKRMQESLRGSMEEELTARRKQGRSADSGGTPRTTAARVAHSSATTNERALSPSAKVRTVGASSAPHGAPKYRGLFPFPPRQSRTKNMERRRVLSAGIKPHPISYSPDFTTSEQLRRPESPAAVADHKPRRTTTRTSTRMAPLINA